MEKLGGQGVNGVVELAQKGLHCITCKLKWLLKLKVEEVTLVNTLKIKKGKKIAKNLGLFALSVQSKHESPWTSSCRKYVSLCFLLNLFNHKTDTSI